MATYSGKFQGVKSSWDMPWRLIRDVTSDFSEEQLIGRGGYGDVYKGVCADGRQIAVKKLHTIPGIYDELNLTNETFSAMKLQHDNVVRLVGCCYEEEELVVQLDGKYIFTLAIHGAICFDYLPNGSLEQYISGISSGLYWQTRYEIIKGMCKGLRYLHEGLKSPILHLNLKLSNILLDKNMLPKLCDFGMPRLVVKENAPDTGSSIGTYGHMPPEYIEKQVISKEFDIYSLGIIFQKLVTGNELYLEVGNISLEEFIELAHEKWRERIQEKVKGRLVEGYCQQVKKCLEIAFKCIEVDIHKRPSISDIIRTLNETETLIEGLKLLHVHPMELRFCLILSVPSKKKKIRSSCSLDLKNRGEDSVAFMLVANSPKRYLFKEPLCGIVPPGSTYTLTLIMLNNKQPLSTEKNSSDFFTLYSVEVAEGGYYLTSDRDSTVLNYKEFFKKMKEMPDEEVQEVTLKVLAYQEANDEGTSCTKATPTTVETVTTADAQQVSSIDVHPTEPWIMTTNHAGSLHVWNYETMAMLNSFQLEAYEPAHVAKFIAREKWLVIGNLDGEIHVYNYEDGNAESFDAHDSCITTMAVHPTSPLILSSSDEDDYLIKLWDCLNGWKCTKEFAGHSGRVTQVKFNPENNDSFASASWDGTIKIWSICSDDTSNITTLKLNERGLCADYFTQYNRQHLIVGCTDRTAQIWELGMKERFHELEGHQDRISVVGLHPELSVLITGSLDGTVRIWDSNTYKPENIISFNLGAVYAFGCIKGSRRIVVGCHQGIATIEISPPEDLFGSYEDNEKVTMS